MSTKERSNSIDELTQQALEEAQNAGLPLIGQSHLL